MAAWGNKYKISYYNQFDIHTEIYIKEYNYVGAVTELTSGDDPLRIILNNNGTEKFQAVRGTSIEIDIMAETDFQFIGLASATYGQYLIYIYADSVLTWKGFILVDFYQEPYAETPYQVTIHGSDGLGLLKNFDFGLTGKKSLVQCLDNIFDNLDFGFIGDFPDLYENINVYEDNISSGAADSVLNQIYLDAEIFYDADGNPMNCYDVLDAILKPFNAYITQSGGAWHIIRVPTNISSYTRRKWVWGGSAYSYNSNASFNPVIATTSATVAPSSLVRFVGNTLTITSPWQKFYINLNYFTRDNIINNGDFKYSTFSYSGGRWHCSNWDDINTPIYTPFPVSLNQIGYILPPGIKQRVIQSPHGQRTNFNPFFYLSYDPDYEYCMKIEGNSATIAIATGIQNNDIDLTSSTDDLLLHLEYLTDSSSADIYVQVILDVAGPTDWYMLSSGLWTNVPSYMIFSNNDPYQWITKEILATGIPGNGNLKINLYQCVIAGNYVKYKNVKLIYMPSDLMPAKSLQHLESISANNLYIPPDIDLLIGDMPDHDNNSIVYKGGLYYFNVSYIPTSIWTDDNTTGNNTLVNLMAYAISADNNKAYQIISGTIYSKLISFISIIQETNNEDKKFMINGCTYHDKSGAWDVDLLQLNETYIRITEASDTRITEGSDTRITE